METMSALWLRLTSSRRLAAKHHVCAASNSKLGLYLSARAMCRSVHPCSMMVRRPFGGLYLMSGDLRVEANSTLVKQEGNAGISAEGGPTRRVHSAKIGTHSEPGGPARHSLGPFSQGLMACAFAAIGLACSRNPKPSSAGLIAAASGGPCARA